MHGLTIEPTALNPFWAQLDIPLCCTRMLDDHNHRIGRLLETEWFIFKHTQWGRLYRSFSHRISSDILQARQRLLDTCDVDHFVGCLPGNLYMVYQGALEQPETYKCKDGSLLFVSSQARSWDVVEPIVQGTGLQRIPCVYQHGWSTAARTFRSNEEMHVWLQMYPHLLDFAYRTGRNWRKDTRSLGDFWNSPLIEDALFKMPFAPAWAIRYYLPDDMLVYRDSIWAAQEISQQLTAAEVIQTRRSFIKLYSIRGCIIDLFSPLVPIGWWLSQLNMEVYECASNRILMIMSPEPGVRFTSSLASAGASQVPPLFYAGTPSFCKLFSNRRVFTRWVNKLHDNYFC